MNCCEATIYPFNGSSMTIDYNTAHKSAYGLEPNVQVYYREGTEFVLSDDMNQVSFDGNSIEIDFGGPAVGIVKVF